MNIFTSSDGFVKLGYSVQKALIEWWTVFNDAHAEAAKFYGPMNVTGTPWKQLQVTCFLLI